FAPKLPVLSLETAIIQTAAWFIFCMILFLATARAQVQDSYAAGQHFRDCPDCPVMVVVPAGGFEMGSPESEPDREDEAQHRVMVKTPFAAGQFAVTRDEFEAFMKDSGYRQDSGCYAWTGSRWIIDTARSYLSPGFEQTGSHPAVCVN